MNLAALRRPVYFVGATVVVLALVAAAAAIWFVSARKNVTLVVDGKARSVATKEATVGGVLGSEKLSTDAHDTVAPAKGVDVKDGGRIVVNHGRPVHLNVDGNKKTVWVTASSVGNVLSRTDVESGSWVSASRSRRIPLDGMSLTVRTPHTATVIADGKTKTVMTATTTVGDLLGEIHVSTGSRDVVRPGVNTLLTPGIVVHVDRVTVANVDTTKTVPNTTVRKADSSLYRGQTKTTVDGHDGTAKVTTKVTKTNGKVVARVQVSRTVTRKPVSTVVVTGTKSAPVAAAASRSSSGSSSGSSSHSGSSSSSGSAPAHSSSGVNWDGVAACESGGNWSTSTGNGYSGGLQFDSKTWQANGGGKYAPSAGQASKSEQIAIADRVASSRGTSPWPVCGKHG